MVGGMVARGYPPEFAERCFKQIEGFGSYGFPESHAASFAKLVYVSAWLKCHQPAVFACALLNSQPMGFYAPAQIVRDAREHAVEVRPVDVEHSDWDCTLEPGEGGPALRLGFRQVGGFSEDWAERLVAGRGAGFGDFDGLVRRSGLTQAQLQKLAQADAMQSLGLDRRQALWKVRGWRAQAQPSPLLGRAARRRSADGSAGHGPVGTGGGRLPHHAAFLEGAPDGLPAPGLRGPPASGPAGGCRTPAAMASRPRSPAWCWSASGPARARWCS